MSTIRFEERQINTSTEEPPTAQLESAIMHAHGRDARPATAREIRQAFDLLSSSSGPLPLSTRRLYREAERRAREKETKH